MKNFSPIGLLRKSSVSFRLQKQLRDFDKEAKRNRDLADWYKAVEEMNMLKDWADDQAGQERSQLRRNASFRTPQEHAVQRKSHKVGLCKQNP